MVAKAQLVLRLDTAACPKKIPPNLEAEIFALVMALLHQVAAAEEELVTEEVRDERQS